MLGAQNTCLNAVACHTSRKIYTCTRVCAPMQQCRNFIAMETIANLSWVMREHRADCHLPPAQVLSRRNQSPDAVRSRHPYKTMLAHDAIATAVLHKHHSVIRVGAGLIQSVYGSQVWEKNSQARRLRNTSQCVLKPGKSTVLDR